MKQSFTEKVISERTYAHANIEMLKWEVLGMEEKLKELREKITDREVELQLLDILLDPPDRKGILSAITDLEYENRGKSYKAQRAFVPENPTRLTLADFKFLQEHADEKGLTEEHEEDVDLDWLCEPPQPSPI